ncbi:phage holin [Priestia megaterium]|uniref:phage holin n=1 Tax=Priestia megaterium TaxID=1404 RepID=UPI00285BD660|nr:phage holin [Priestia megaterium]MDR7207610.1 putative membrane protein [Priestia megaterium]
MLKKLGTRLKNGKVLMSVISGIILILVNLGVIDAEFVSHYEVTINTILGILVGLGVISDPESHLKK